MQTETLTIINKLGLHARASIKLVNLASRFLSETKLKLNGREVNAKDTMEIMVLAASQGTIVELTVEGPDEEEAMTAIKGLFEDRFGESE